MAKVVEKGKKKRKPKKPSEKWKKYKISGENIERTNPNCPRCGPGIFLAKSKTGDRLHCGKCHYTSFDKEEIAKANK